MISWFIAILRLPTHSRQLSQIRHTASADRGLNSRLGPAVTARVTRPLPPSRRPALPLLLGIVQIDIEAERAHFLDQHVEAFRNARFERVVAAHDRLVHLGTAGDVVRLHGEHFLQGVGGAVGFERPHLHFAEALAAELRLAAERLLGDQRVRADRAGVDLVVHQMVQLEHVDVADGDLAIEHLAGAAVEDADLAGMIEAGKVEHLLDVGFLGAVEHRRRDRHAVTQVAAEFDQLRPRSSDLMVSSSP